MSQTLLTTSLIAFLESHCKTIFGWPTDPTKAFRAITAILSVLPFFSVGMTAQLPKASSTATRVVSIVSCGRTFGKQ